MAVVVPDAVGPHRDGLPNVAFLALEHPVAVWAPFVGGYRTGRKWNGTGAAAFITQQRRHAKQDKRAAAEGSVPHNHTRGSYDASDKIQGRTPSRHALDPGRQAAGAISRGIASVGG